MTYEHLSDVPLNILISVYIMTYSANAGTLLFLYYMLRQNGKRFYKGLYATLKLAPDLKKNTVYLSSYSLSNEGHLSILTN